MLYRIAALLGRTVEQLLGELSTDEFREWAALYDLEPWGFQADAWCAGTVSATVANYAGRTRKRPDARPSDFMPNQKKRPRRMTQDEMRARVKADIEKAGKRNG